eukprot:scaffold136001_cov31-Tisochrysis_lutea.AAC.5
MPLSPDTDLAEVADMLGVVSLVRPALPRSCIREWTSRHPARGPTRRIRRCLAALQGLVISPGSI